MSEASQEPLRGEVMDVEGVAEYLGFSPSTIYEKVQSKDIPHVRIGNSLRFPKAVIDRWLEASTIQAMPSFYARFVRMASAFFFQKWLESRGVDPAKLDDEQLADLVSRASKDLQASQQGRPGSFQLPAVMNLERFGLLQDPELGLLQAYQPDPLLSRAPAVSKASPSSRAEVLERAFDAPSKKKKGTAEKPAEKKPSQSVESAKKTKAKTKKTKKPAEKAKAKAKPPTPPTPVSGELQEKLKKKFKLVDFAEDITGMSLAILRQHFGYISGSINKALFVNNIIWQVYRLGQTGDAPAFIKNGGNGPLPLVLRQKGRAGTSARLQHR